MSSAQIIRPDRARLWLPLDGQWHQGLGSNLLVNGDFEAGTAGWTPQNSTLTVVPGSPSGVGTQVLNVLAGGGNGYAKQIGSMTVGYYYSCAGWSRGVDASAYPAVGDGASINLFWTGAVSATWTYHSGVAAATNATFLLSALGGAKTCQFDDLVLLDAPMITRNLGSAPGAPTYVRMGDGQTPTTFPTQRTGSRGVRFDGGDYMRVPMDFTYDAPFTIAVLTDSRLSAAGYFAATYDGPSNTGMWFGSAGSGAIKLEIFDASGGSIRITSANNYLPTDNQPRLYCATYNGGGSPGSLSMFIDEVNVPVSSLGTSISGSISSGKDMLIGARWSGASPTNIMPACNMYCVAEYPTVLDSYDRRLLKARMMQEIHAP